MNLVNTYMELGRCTKGAHVWSEQGFKACVGSLEHPICNFAVDVDLNEDVAARLKEVAVGRPCFNIYTMPPQDTSRHHQILEEEGFALSHRLKLMVAPAVASDSIELAEATLPHDRRKTAEFMMDQFFHRQPTSFRHGIAEATASARCLKLFKAEWNKKAAGAVMISEHAGMLGIYNLCVAPPFRRRGWGTAIVKSVVEKARSKNYGVTLQCEPGLAAWYVSLGFQEVGSVSVYGLFRFKEIDIMR
jgi:GNAT superfamily N-acetyltransferase